MGSQQKADRLQVQKGTLLEQVGALKQQGGAKSQEHAKGATQPGLPFYYFRTLFWKITPKRSIGSVCVRA